MAGSDPISTHKKSVRLAIFLGERQEHRLVVLEELLEVVNLLALQKGSDEVVAELFEEVCQLQDVDQSFFDGCLPLFVFLHWEQPPQHYKLLDQEVDDVVMQAGGR